MKDTSIRVRMSSDEKSKVVELAERVGKSTSELIRTATSALANNKIPGTRERAAAAAIRQSSNLALTLLAAHPIDKVRLVSALQKLRADARELIRCT